MDQPMSKTNDELGFQGWLNRDEESLALYSKIKIPDEMIEPPSATEKKVWIQTFTGKKFDPIHPSAVDISLLDIAHALSNMCRFTGHVKEFYSVAQHCVLVSYICDSKDALHGLLHDASEAYLVDIPRPIKRSGKMEGYRELENNLQSLIYQKFGLSSVEPEGVKVADTALLATEARDLMAPLHPDWRQPAKPLPFTITPLSPKEAKQLFLDRYNELTGAG